MMDVRGDQDPEPLPIETTSGIPRSGRAGRFSISARMTYLLIGGAAMGLIVLMCLVVALIAMLRNA